MKKIVYALFSGFLICGVLFGQPSVSVAQVHPVESTSTTVSGIIPQNIYVPDLELFTEVEQVGKTPRGAMNVPVNWENVAWYGMGFSPGENGHAVFAAHRDWSGNTGPFWDLGTLDVGSLILVVGENNRVLVFSVVSSASYDRNANVANQVFGLSDTPRISLITCEGDFLSNESTYDLRRVVDAELVFDTGEI